MADTGTDTRYEEPRFACEQCGAVLRFDPAARALKCDHCGHEQPLVPDAPASGALAEMDFDRAIADLLPPAENGETRTLARTLGCPGCAARIEFDPDTQAAECPFCATPMVADTGTRRQIRPGGVLPFALDEATARKAMTDWLGRLWLAPNGIRDHARKGRRMQGVYVPCWTFDADTRSRYAGERGTIHHEIQMVARDGKQVRERVASIRWTSASGRVERVFDDLLVLASRSLPKAWAEALQPWDLAALQPYQPHYLAGFRAEAYTVELKDGFAEARERMDRIIARDVRFDIGGDQQRIHHIATDIDNVTFKHVLLPVWLAAYKYRGRTWRFVVNGRSGRVQGERPWSAIKIAIAVIAGALAAAAIGYLLAINQ